VAKVDYSGPGWPASRRLAGGCRRRQSDLRDAVSSHPALRTVRSSIGLGDGAVLGGRWRPALGGEGSWQGRKKRECVSKARKTAVAVRERGGGEGGVGAGDADGGPLSGVGIEVVTVGTDLVGARRAASRGPTGWSNHAAGTRFEGGRVPSSSGARTFRGDPHRHRAVPRTLGTSPPCSVAAGRIAGPRHRLADKAGA